MLGYDTYNEFDEIGKVVCPATILCLYMHSSGSEYSMYVLQLFIVYSVCIRVLHVYSAVCIRVLVVMGA